MYDRRTFGISAILAALGIGTKMTSNQLPPPPDRPSLGSTFKRPINELTVGPPGSGHIEIGSTIPPEIAAFYTAYISGAVGNAIVQFFVNATDYYYMVAGLTAGLNPQFFGAGWVIGGNVIEFENNGIFGVAGSGQPIVTVEHGPLPQTDSAWNFGNQPNQSSMGLIGTLLSLAPGAGIPSQLDITGSGSNQGLLTLGQGTDFRYNNISQNRDLAFSQWVTVPANSGAVAGTETVMFTMGGTAIFRTGRAYEVSFTSAKLKSLAVNNPAVNLYRGSIAGLRIIQGARYPIPATGLDLAFNPVYKFINITGADINDGLAIGMAPSVATLVTLDAGAGNLGWGFEVNDIGDATKYANYPTIS